MKNIADHASSTEIQILLVDDDRDAATLIERFLLRRGFFVTAFTDPSLALAHLSSNRYYNLLLTDVRMPKINGFEVARIAKSINPQIQVLLITSSPIEYFNAELKKSKADGIIEKPTKLSSVPDMILKFVLASELKKTIASSH